MVLVGALGAGQVPRGAALRRHAEDIAARREQGALAVGRQGVVDLLRRIDVADLILDVGDVGAGARIVVRHVDRHLAHLFARQVESIELAALLEGDRIAAQRREVDVVVGEVGDLAGLLAVLVIDPDVGAPMLSRSLRK